jgi:hypothetical protein
MNVDLFLNSSVVQFDDGMLMGTQLNGKLPIKFVRVLPTRKVSHSSDREVVPSYV